jgi:glycosyltransferase involved in cell wall biosynthesis
LSTLEYSVVVPVYGNEGSLDELLARLADLASALPGDLEAVFVVDGSPDASYSLLADRLPRQTFTTRLVAHSRNFGSFAAIHTGLTARFFRVLSDDEADLVVGTRRTRDDPPLTTLPARLFWSSYRRLVQPEMPTGGVDVFACTATFRDHLVKFQEANSSLVAMAIWLGFRRTTIDYDRLPRNEKHGRSGWTLRRKMKYLSDSVFSFTDLPIRVLLGAGCLGVLASIVLAIVITIARLTGSIDVPGYAATVMVIAFFGALNLAGLGIVGAYVWRAFENTKRRPGAVVMGVRDFDAASLERP